MILPRLSKNRNVAYHPANRAGRDFVVGDVHGHFSLLYRLLRAAGFNGHRDRCFLAGDLVDRGPESEHVVEILRQPWCFAVRGNHDQWCVDAVFDTPNPAHLVYGGAWFYGIPSQERCEIATLLRDLPVAIEIEAGDGRRVGVVHGECTHQSWPCFLEGLSGGLTEGYAEYHAAEAMWRRQRFEKKRPTPISGVDQIYVGHCVTPEVIELGNVCYLDTGSFLPGGKLSMIEVGNPRIVHSVENEVPHRYSLYSLN